MKIKVLYIFACFMLLGAVASGQQRKFASNDEAVKYLNDVCNKYWLVNTKDGDISREITVYQHGCQLFFNEKSIMKKAGTESNIVLNTLISVNLRRTKQTGNYAFIEFTGGKKDIVTLVTQGNGQLNNKGTYGSKYRVALDYTNQLLKNELNDLTTATDYLLKACHPKPAKHKKKVAHKK